MNAQKLLRQALENPQGLRFAEARKPAEAFGFHLDRISGSRHIFKPAAIPELVNVQNVRGMAKAYQVRQLLSLVGIRNLTLND